MRVLVNGVRIYFEVVGEKLALVEGAIVEKPTLLVLHGGPGFDHHGMRGFYDRFADVAQVIYLDHRGNGRSERGPLESLNLFQWGQDIKAFCEALDIEKPIVLGHSFGGFVAESYMTQFPDHPGAIVLSCTQGRSDPGEASYAVYRRLGGPEVEAAAKAFFTEQNLENMLEFQRLCRPHYNQSAFTPWPLRNGIFTPETLVYFWREGVSPDEGGWRDFNFLPQFHKVICPVLVLGGEDDPACPIEFQEEIMAYLPPGTGKLHRFAQCGHGTHVDHPDATETIIRDFLVEVAG